MSYRVKTIPYFDKQAKRLAKKYPSLKSDLANLITSLLKDPFQGISLGKNCYKIRMAVKSKKIKGVTNDGLELVEMVEVVEKRSITRRSEASGER